MQLSVAMAKKAVALDVVDGSSWYVLGLAQLAQCFALHSLNLESTGVAATFSRGAASSNGSKAGSSLNSSNGSGAGQQAPIRQVQQVEVSQAGDMEDLRLHASMRYQSGRLMQAALNAFQQAQRCGLDQLADLYYNRGVVYQYLQVRKSGVN